MTPLDGLVRLANPIPDPKTEFSNDDVAALLVLTRARSGDMDTREIHEPVKTKKQDRRGWLVAAATFAVIIALAGGSIWLGVREDESVEPAADVTVTTEANQALAAAESTALAFLEARRNFDLDAATRLLDDAAVVGLGPADSKQAMSLELRWTEASGMVVTPETCEAESTAGSASVAVHCTATATSPIVELGDQGPLTFDYEATVENGVITSIELVDIGEYSQTVWEPFEQWIRISRPDAHATMYGDVAGSSVALTDESIELWRQYTIEYVNEKTYSDAFDVAQRYLRARYQGDVDTAVSLLTAHAVLDWGPGTTPAELPGGLAWEDALGISFTPRTCVVLSGPSEGETGEVVNIRCPLFATSAISEAIDDPGDLECATLVVNDGVIESAAIGVYVGAECSGFNFGQRVFDPFTAWLSKAHPELVFDDLYNQRRDADDIEQWRQLTEEFVTDATGG